MSRARTLEDILHHMWENGEVVEVQKDCFLSRPRVKEAKQAIIELFKGCVPKELNLLPNPQTTVDIIFNNSIDSWNACREEILSRIENLV